VAKLIIELKLGKDGQIEYIVTYHDPKTDNQFTLTTTNDLNEAVEPKLPNFLGARSDFSPQ